MMQRVALAALSMYGGLMWLVQPLVRAKLARRAQAEPLYGEYTGERFGDYTAPDAINAATPVPIPIPIPIPSASQPLVWVHAVSLGETRAAAILIAQLRLLMPTMRLLLTHSTATGRAEGAALLQPGDVQAWLPWDTAGACQRFLAHFAPHIGVLMETEVWPQMCAQARAARVPLVLVNARLSEKSLRAAQRLSAIARPAYAALTGVLAQTQADAARLCATGAAVQAVVGNLKFDAKRDEALWNQGRAWRRAVGAVGVAGRQVVMLAASREGEEEQFLEEIMALASVEYAQAAIKNIASDKPDALPPEASKVLWLVVPRHPQRFDAVAQLFKTAGMHVARRSDWQGAVPAAALQADVWLGDSMGEMAQYYALADVALLGGSFARLGGQNLIEAIACDCPVIMGPHTFNFDEAARTAQTQGAAVRVADMKAGVETALQLIGQPAQRAAMQASGRVWLRQSSGAAERTARAIAAVLSGTA